MSLSTLTIPKRELIGSCTHLPPNSTLNTSPSPLLQCTYKHHWFFYAGIGIISGFVAGILVVITAILIWKHRKNVAKGAMLAANPAGGATKIGIGVAAKMARKPFAKKAQPPGPPQAAVYGYVPGGLAMPQEAYTMHPLYRGDAKY